MRALTVAATTAAAIIGLSVVPSFAADLRPPPPPVAQYDDDDFDPIDENVPAPVAVAPLPPAPVVDTTVYVYGGRDYCWFEGGWNGAGWYVCDYGPWVRGSWWGGPAGWNGWAWRGGPRFYDRPYRDPRFGYGRPYGGPRFGYGPPPDFRRGFYGPRGYAREAGFGRYGGQRHWGGRYR